MRTGAECQARLEAEEGNRMLSPGAVSNTTFGETRLERCGRLLTQEWLTYLWGLQHVVCLYRSLLPLARVHGTRARAHTHPHTHSQACRLYKRPRLRGALSHIDFPSSKQEIWRKIESFHNAASFIIFLLDASFIHILPEIFDENIITECFHQPHTVFPGKFTIEAVMFKTLISLFILYKSVTFPPSI